MSNFGILHMHGEGETNPQLSCLEPLYDELFTSNYTDGTVSVSNDDLALIIEAFRTENAIVLINANDLLSGKHMTHVPKERVIELWKLLIEGKTDEIFAQPWQDGYR